MLRVGQGALGAVAVISAAAIFVAAGGVAGGNQENMPPVRELPNRAAAGARGARRAIIQDALHPTQEPPSPDTPFQHTWMNGCTHQHGEGEWLGCIGWDSDSVSTHLAVSRHNVRVVRVHHLSGEGATSGTGGLTCMMLRTCGQTRCCSPPPPPLPSSPNPRHRLRPTKRPQRRPLLGYFLHPHPR